MDSNLLRINYEVENNIQWIPTSNYALSFQEFKTSTENPDYLALCFIANYERPAEPNQPIRGIQANYWYEYLGGITPPKPSKKETKFKWVLYSKKLRNRRIFY